MKQRKSRAVPTTASTRDLLSIPEAAAKLHVSKATVWRWIGLGAIAVQKLGGRTFIRQERVDHILTHNFTIPVVRKYEAGA